VDVANAISKVRFGSARPQRVHLHKGDGLAAELLCMEPGQQTRVLHGEWMYYVIAGHATVRAGAEESEIASGHSVAFAPDEDHTIANVDEGRLICLAFTKAE